MPFVSTETWQFLLADNSNSVLADLSNRVLDPVVSPRLSVPSMQTWTLPCTTDAIGAGFSVGQRRGIAIRNGQVVANDILWRTKPAGGPSSGYMTAEFLGPMIRWETRYCMDSGGQIFDGPSASGTDRGMNLPAGVIANPLMSIGAGEVLRQALANTIAVDGDLGITLGGPFSSSPIPTFNAIFPIGNMSPLRISELATMYREAGACDIVITPTSGGSSQGSVSAIDRAGTDLPGTSFDYGTGANNVAWAYPESDMDGFANKIRFLIGRRSGSHFKNSVDATTSGVTSNPASSRSTYGVYADNPMHSTWNGSVKTGSELFKSYLLRFSKEQELRMVPRTVVRIQPQAGLAPEPWTNYNLGDTPRLNIAQLGLDLSGVSFRIIGWDCRPERNGAERTELLIGWAPQ